MVGCKGAAKWLALIVPLMAVALVGPVTGDSGKVSLSADRISLVELARELTRQSGVPHRALGKEAERQKIVIVCQDQSAASVRDAVSKLLGWTWERSQKDQEPTYTLIKSLALRRREAALRERFSADYNALLVGLAEKAQQEGEALKGDPSAQFFADPTSNALLGGLRRLNPQQLEGVMVGQGLSGSSGTLPQPIRQVVDGVLAGENQGRANPTTVRTTDLVRLEVARDSTGRPESLQLAVHRGNQLLLQFNAGHLSQAQALGHRFGTEAPEGQNPATLQDPRMRARLAQLPPMQWPAPPAPTPTVIGWQVRDLGRRTTFPLIADCYPEMEAVTAPYRDISKPYQTPELEGRTLLSALGQMTDGWGYSWDLQGDWIALRYRDWYWEPLRKPASAR